MNVTWILTLLKNTWGILHLHIDFWKFRFLVVILTMGWLVLSSLCNMRAMPIRIFTGHSGWLQLRASFKKNWIHYLQEALGLGIFMASACFFSAMLFSPKSSWYSTIPALAIRNILMGVAMGSTALFIFYSPLTAPSGSQINPAVSLSFLRAGKMCRYDLMFYIIFQLLGGTAFVFIMQLLLGTTLTDCR